MIGGAGVTNVGAVEREHEGVGAGARNEPFAEVDASKELTRYDNVAVLALVIR